jgi:hypothetical protein
MRRKFKGWNINTKGKIQKDKTNLFKKLNELELLQEDRDLSMEEYSIWEDSKLKIDKIYFDEEIYWQQRSSLQWILEGDLNTKFFYTIINNRKKKNNIYSLIINNDVIWDQSIIRNHILNYYKTLLGSIQNRIFTLNLHIWDENEQLEIILKDKLEEPITIEEIKKKHFLIPKGIKPLDHMEYLFPFIKLIGTRLKMI